MNTKDFSKMAILDQSVLQKAEKGRFVVDKDYNLNGARLVVPNGMTIDFNGGSINNGTLELNDNTMLNLRKNSIDAIVTGIMSNNVIYTSTIGGADNLNLTSYSNKVIYFDQNDTINNTLTLNGSSHVLFDGLNNQFTCNVNFFVVNGACVDVEICNFHAVAGTNQNVEFQKMLYDNCIRRNVYVHHNVLDGFKVGISFDGYQNPDGASLTVGVFNCKASNNYILNAKQTYTGTNENSDGYAIHLGNARHCEIVDNYIENAGRHAIYHAYGQYNRIARNTIKEHRRTMNNSVVRSAIPVYRNSRYIIIEDNNFINNYNVSIHAYETSEATSTTATNKYNHQVGIVIRNNHFCNTDNHGVTVNSTSITGYLHPAIMVGYNAQSPTLDKFYVDDITIENNHFEFVNSVWLFAIRVYYCRNIVIRGNQFTFGYMPNITAPITTYPFCIVSIEPYYKTLAMKADIVQNTFKGHVLGSLQVWCISYLGDLLTGSNFVVSVQGNHFLNYRGASGLVYNIYKGYNAYTDQTYRSNIFAQKENVVLNAVPTSGYHLQGDMALVNNNGTLKRYWCSSTGSPGTWVQI